jgi:hypothetical protein
MVNPVNLMTSLATAAGDVRFGECPAPQGETIEIRRYLSRSELLRLAATGSTDSRDEPLSSDETTEENVGRLYALAGVERPAQFTSLAIMIRHTSNGKTALQAYGANIPILHPRTLEDILVVNGDMKNVSRYVQDGDEQNVIVRRGTAIDHAELCGLADNNKPSSRGPRLRGTYFEGRLLRALRVGDVQTIYLRYPDDQEATNAARTIFARTAASGGRS